MAFKGQHWAPFSPAAPAGAFLSSKGRRVSGLHPSCFRGGARPRGVPPGDSRLQGGLHSPFSLGSQVCLLVMALAIISQGLAGNTSPPLSLGCVASMVICSAEE